MFNRGQIGKQLQPQPAARDAGFARYAISYTPAPGTELAAFGRSWFGRVNDGATLEAFSASGLTGAAAPSTSAGRYTGLHALFGAPFALREDIPCDALRTRLMTFTAHRKPVNTGPLALASSSGYLTLRPVEPAPALDWLATQCVRAIEDLALAPEDEEMGEDLHPGHHQPPSPGPFGQPHAERAQHRFSIVLAGPLPAAHLERVSQALWPVLDRICDAGVTVDGVSLLGDAGGRAPLRLIGRYGLRG